MLFHSAPRYVDMLSRYTADQIEAETMLFRASADYAACGGQITRDFLRVLRSQADALGVDFDNVVIDSRVHMLMRGWYPCIPGWHHDDVPRSGRRDQPDYDRSYALTSRHLMAVVDATDAPTGALPEFATKPIDVPWPLPEESTVYAVWDAHINTTHPGCGEAVRSSAVYAFDAASFHRGMPATGTGWRFFIRATWNTYQKPANKVRRNANVYMPSSTAGW